MMVLASALRIESMSTLFFRPRVKGWIARSAVLDIFIIQETPNSKNMRMNL